jgi:hypothetical protein
MTQNLFRDGVSYTDPRRIRFWIAIPGCIFLRKNFQNDVPPQKIPLLIGNG